MVSVLSSSSPPLPLLLSPQWCLATCARHKPMDVIKREIRKEVKRVASGGGHFRPTSDELGLRVCTK